MGQFYEPFSKKVTHVDTLACDPNPSHAICRDGLLGYEWLSEQDRLSGNNAFEGIMRDDRITGSRVDSTVQHHRQILGLKKIG
jgi:hypothetical protein